MQQSLTPGNGMLLPRTLHYFSANVAVLSVCGSCLGFHTKQILRARHFWTCSCPRALRRQRPLSVTVRYASDKGTARRGAEPLWSPLKDFLGLDRLDTRQKLDISRRQLTELLTTNDRTLIKSMYAVAEAATTAYFGTKVYARGIVEFSNVCTKDCFYCGIRKHTKVHRYTMTKEEILACAEFAYSQGMGTLMLQSGELPSPERINFMLDVVRAIRRRTMDLACESPPFPSAGPNQRDFPSQRGLAVALSLGELPSSVYQAFLEAGASRYLLRIETSNPTLYTRLHPASHSFQARRKCLEELQRIGFQVGTGVMVGVPFQTVEDQANDLLFFKELDPDMIGLGPYIVQSQTPLGKLWLEEHGEESAAKQEANRVALLERTTRMYALARIMLGNVNIAATTALEALDPEGRELALRRGANVVMPIITPQRLRGQYEIYENKPGIDQDALDSTACLERRVRMAGKDLLLDGGWHDPPHFVRPSVE